MNERGMLVVYSGPSGVGKGTVLSPYLKSHPNAVLSVSVTTRAPRPGETDGVEYHFIDRAEFDRLVEGGGLLEHAEYSGNCYGTPRAAVERELAAGRDVVLEIEVQGAMQVRESFPEAVFVFILPPSYEVLRQRLIGRGTESPEAVEKRLHRVNYELSFAPRYDFAIVNDEVDAACAKLAAVIEAAKCRIQNMRTMIDEVREFHEYA